MQRLKQQHTLSRSSKPPDDGAFRRRSRANNVFSTSKPRKQDAPQHESRQESFRPETRSLIQQARITTPDIWICEKLCDMLRSGDWLARVSVLEVVETSSAQQRATYMLAIRASFGDILTSSARSTLSDLTIRICLGSKLEWL